MTQSRERPIQELINSLVAKFMVEKLMGKRMMP